MAAVNLPAAGIDVGAEVHYVAVPPSDDPQPVRRFGAYTAALDALATWLTACGITTVALESTGVYWIPLFELLEARHFLWEGSPLPAGLRPRLDQEWEPVKALAQRMARVAAERRAVLQTAEDAVRKKVQHLLMLTGIGTNSAWVFVMAFFGWRALRHRKAVGTLRGLTPPPSARGTTASARGITTAGNYPIRAMAMESAWGWRRCQPESARTQWYQQRCVPRE